MIQRISIGFRPNCVVSKLQIKKVSLIPREVIQRFINRSWWFMSAYRKGLTGAAAAWAVRKQKQLRAINQTVMMAIDVLMNPAAPVSGVTEA
jgi:hypothetical protein